MVHVRTGREADDQIAYDCPWKKNVDFHIPADLPACPEGGCHCSWGWVHSKDGGSAQMYQLGYRCDVTGAQMTRPLPKRKSGFLGSTFKS
jgi:hypothetical protein